MAGFFTHEWIANLVLQKLMSKQFLSNFENSDDYFFGAIAPDIRYITQSPRDVTHKPFGNDSLFEALKASTTSTPFVAGYETHLITDMAWSNDKNWLNQSIYERYDINPNDSAKKFALYWLVDDYFQAEADSFFPLACAGNILRANDNGILLKLGVKNNDILFYKSLLAAYFREPGINTFTKFSFVPNNLDEVLIRNILDKKTDLMNFLKEFKNAAVEKCISSLERYI